MKLTRTGQWTWRLDELSYKQFTLLPKEEKEEHLFLLKGLKPEEISTNDFYILKLNETKIEKNNEPYKFLEL